MKAKITKVDGLIHRIETKHGEGIYMKGLTDWDYILLNRTYRKYRKSEAFLPSNH